LSAVHLHWSPRIEKVEVFGAPDLLVGPISGYLQASTPGFSSRAMQLRTAFPALKTVRIHRSWGTRSVRVEVSLRRAMARALRAGGPAGFLDEDGTAFAAPDGLYPETLPVVDVGSADAAQLKDLPAMLDAFSRDEGLPVPVARTVFRSAQEGWEFILRDGTDILWGSPRWMPEKLARLRAALADARGHIPSAFTADLRYFEDGRVLLRPLAGSRLSAR
jgi:hypothetical protein